MTGAGCLVTALPESYWDGDRTPLGPEKTCPGAALDETAHRRVEPVGGPWLGPQPLRSQRLTPRTVDYAFLLISPV